MSSTLDEAFFKFLSLLELTDNQSSFIAEKHKAIRAKIEESSIFKVQNTLLYGSYERSSQIRPAYDNEWTLDVDILVILDDSEKSKYLERTFTSGHDLLMDDLQKAVGKFQGLEIVRDTPAISIKWQTQKVIVELTPALNRKDGGFYIPKNTFFEDWIISDPFADAEALTKGNQALNNNLKPLVKALKCWNRQNDYFLPSFAIETVAYHSATKSKFRGYEVELRWFFKSLLEFGGKNLPSPSGKNGDVFIDLKSNESLIRKTLTSLQHAYDLEKNGDHSLAIREMQNIFGIPFPNSPGGR